MHRRSARRAAIARPTWSAIAHPSPFGAAEALALVDELAAEPALAGYHLVPCVRADLLLRLDRRDEARRELEHAARMTTNERALLAPRAATI